jgi:hypothetical protein
VRARSLACTSGTSTDFHGATTTSRGMEAVWKPLSHVYGDGVWDAKCGGRCGWVAPAGVTVGLKRHGVRAEASRFRLKRHGVWVEASGV